MSILDNFPLDKPRGSQVAVLQAIEEAFAKGFKNVLLEAPVGSGKSAIAIAVAKFYGRAHILTPRKSLQDQYYHDFKKESLATMKGRSSYPCTYVSEENPAYPDLAKRIKAGKLVYVIKGQTSCNEGPCLSSSRMKKLCTKPGGLNEPDETPCPYHIAIDTAQSSSIIIHNLHGFIFQTYYSERFDERSVIVVDEAHEMEDVLRGFAEKTVLLPTYIKDADMPISSRMVTLRDWASYLSNFDGLFSDKTSSTGTSQKEDYASLMETLKGLSEIVGAGFVVSTFRDARAKRSSFTFTPEYVGNLSDKYILNFGQKRLLMSGTIYNKDMYCSLNGLVPSETCFIKIGSSFPKKLRPIYMKDEYLVDTSHKMWDANFTKIITNIKTVMSKFGDVKGLIHAPSYHAATTLALALRDTGRILTHTKDNFQSVLEEFYNSAENTVLISPICQQGVDFKQDRARFQIILRVPYPSTADALMAKKVKEDFRYYNYQALIVFGQQIGRVNRSEDDFGVTVLMDSRFPKFIGGNKSWLPAWMLEAIIR